MKRHPGRNVLRLVGEVLRGRHGGGTEPATLTVPADLYDNIRTLLEQIAELDRQEALGECPNTPSIDGGCSVCNLASALQEARFTWYPKEP